MPKSNPITLEELYENHIHGITYELFPRVLGAKIYKGQQQAELRLNFNGNVRKFLATVDELKELRDAITFLHKSLKQKNEAGL